MSISSIGNNYGLYAEIYKTMNLGTTNAVSNSNNSSGSSQTVYTSADGDTLQLTGSSQQIATGQYAPPPPPPSESSATSDQQSFSEMFSNLDSNSDGTVSEDEFVAGRPDDVTEEMAANLYSSFDTDSSGTLSESELQTSMNNTQSAQMAPPPPPPPENSGSSDDTDSDTEESLTDMFSNLDTDGDGSVSQEEFLAARPDDVTEEMAANLYNSFDADGSGTVSESEYQTAMNNRPVSAIG